MKGKVPAKHCFSAPRTETKQYKSTSVVEKEETKSENYHHNKKKTHTHTHKGSKGEYVTIK